MGFSGIGVLAVGLAYCGFRRFRRSKLGFTQADRERMDQRFDQVEKQMVRMETTQQMFMESTNQRFEQMLNMMDQRFAEQRDEDINQRFEQADKRFAEMMSFLQIITGIFTVIMAAAIGFAFWDRRTTGSKAKEVTLEALAKDEESRKNALAEQVVAEVFRRLESRKTTPPKSAPLPTMS
jgi:hypothetical protein